MDVEPKYLPDYRTLYTTAHKGPCTTAAFSHDGRFIATGSADTSLKVIDVFALQTRERADTRTAGKACHSDII